MITQQYTIIDNMNENCNLWLVKGIEPSVIFSSSFH